MIYTEIKLQSAVSLKPEGVLKGLFCQAGFVFVFSHVRLRKDLFNIYLNNKMCPLCFLSAAADGIGGLGTEQTHLNVPVADPSAWATAMNNLGIMPIGLTGQQLVSGRAMHLSPLISNLDFSPLSLAFLD